MSLPKDYRGSYVSTAPDVTREQVRSASTDDARVLLGALGLPGGGAK